MATKKAIAPVAEYAEDIELCIKLRRTLTTFDSEYSYLGCYEGDLLNVDTRALAGKVKLFVVDLEGADKKGFGASGTLDLEAATEPYIALLSEEAGNFIPAVLKILGEEFVLNSNMLIIDRLELLPAYRGRGLGLKCMAACIRHLSAGCRIAAIKPFPLQFEPAGRTSDEWQDALAFKSLSRDKRASTKRLKQHYGQLGFKHVSRTDLMVRDLYEE
jgi:GNAT superfamily N-acetyltransferase